MDTRSAFFSYTVITSRTRAASFRCSSGTISFMRREMLALMSMAGKWPLLASFRDRTMWPSRMPRTVSAMGSLVSSPSTRTV